MRWRIDRLLHGENMKFKYFIDMTRSLDPVEAVETEESVYGILFDINPEVDFSEIGEMRMSEIEMRIRVFRRKMKAAVDDGLERLGDSLESREMSKHDGWDGVLVNKEWKGNNWGDNR